MPDGIATKARKEQQLQHFKYDLFFFKYSFRLLLMKNLQPSKPLSLKSSGMS